MVLTGYTTLLLMLLFAAILPFLLMGLSQVVQIKQPSALKFMVYESGMTPYGSAHVKFDLKFYMYALLFILFDIETIFLFPWAVAFDDLVKSLGIFPIVEMFIFIGILVLGLAYAWRRDALRWQ
ncbi:MAG: NADH-quinone oxidoreductase subunit A [Cyanobacteria bacterium P01_H01_bin.74]